MVGNTVSESPRSLDFGKIAVGGGGIGVEEGVSGVRPRLVHW